VLIPQPRQPCVHIQEPHNKVRVDLYAACPWCELEVVTQRLRKAEAIIADAASSWEAAGSAYFREQQLRHATYRPFLNSKPGEP
jgi:glutathionyl-hydroquinone reductase